MYDSMVFYRSFYDAIKELSDDCQLEVYQAVFKYGLYGETTELSGMAKAIFALIKPQIDANNKRKEVGKKGADFGKKGGRPKKQKTPMGLSEKTPMGLSDETPTGIQSETPNVNVNANVNVNDNVVRIAKRFSPPTIDEVSAYCRERSNHVDPQRFVDFYTSKGWKVGSQPMKDWKAAVRTWEQRDRERDKDKPMQGSLSGDLDYLERLAALDIKNS